MNEQHVITEVVAPVVPEACPVPTPVATPVVNKTKDQIARENFQAAQGAIQKLLESNIEVARFLGQKSKNFKVVFSSIISQLRSIDKGDTICIGPKNLQDVRDTVNYLKKLITEEPMTAEFNTFLDVWCNLVLNWNKNSANNSSLSYDCILLSRLSQGYFTLFELFDFTKKLIGQQKRMTQYALPPIELAHHYDMSMTGPGKPSEVPTSGPLLETK